MIIKYMIAWCGLVILGILNGVLRQYTYGKHMNALTAHQISSVTAIVLIGVFVWLITRWWGLDSASQAIIVGVLWLGLTVAFEFLFGHYIMNHPWSRLLHDYNLLKGRLWILVLLWTTVAPYVFYRLRH